MSNNCVAWSSVGSLPMGQTPVLETGADSLDPILYGGMLRPAMMQVEGGELDSVST